MRSLVSLMCALFIAQSLLGACTEPRHPHEVYNDPILLAVGDKPRSYTFISLQQGDFAFWLTNLAAGRFPLTNKALSDCGIQVHALLGARIAIGEPFRIRAEIDGDITTDALFCYLGNRVMDRLGRLGVTIRDRKGGVSIERDVVLPGTANAAAEDLLRSCHASQTISVCTATMLGPPEHPLFVEATMTDMVVKMRLHGLGRGAREFVAAVNNATARFPNLRELAVRVVDGTLETTVPLYSLTDAYGTLIRELVIFSRAPTNAMEPAVRKGDWLLLARAAFPPAPAPGEMIVYTTVDGVGVGRLIARAGQTVTEDAQGISVDGTRLVTDVVENGLVREYLGDRSYLTAPAPEPGVGSWIVPTGHVFVLSDTRSSAEDSRHVGPIPIGKIAGRILGNAFSIGKQGPDWNRSGTRPE